MKVPALSFLLLAVSTGLVGVPASSQDRVVNWETPHVHPLDITPDRNLLLAVNTPDNRLMVFTLGTGVPVLAASRQVGLDPVSVRARNNTEAWVVNHVSDSVSVVSLITGEVRANLPTDDEPCDVVFAGNPKRAFVTCSQANTILVFNPSNLSAPPTRIAIRAEDPRALAVSPAGDKVYAAVFESGNQTTILPGGTQDFDLLPYPPLAASDATGPYGGQNPPPNSGSSFDPPINPALPPPPAVALIVRRNAAGQWMDDNQGDWTDLVSGANAARSGRPVGWVLLDHDVAIIDAATLDVTYADHLMNLNMALGVNPVTGDVTVVGVDSRNEIRYIPKLNGDFLRVQFAKFSPAAPGTPTVVDLNTHVNYSTPTLPQTERDKSIGDPRGIVWNAAGTRGYVAGMGSNNLVVVGPSGARIGLNPTIEVGDGPTGIVIDDPRSQVYVLNKFEGSISVVSTVTELETARVRYFDPSPAAIKRGRPHLYDTHETSGNGLLSCASCHVDARTDKLSWDMGDPAGDLKLVESDQNKGAGIIGLGAGGSYQPWHPMKGPMLTQTLQDIIGHEPHHWRGDKDGIEEFNEAFEKVMGDDSGLSAVEMQEFEDFLATIAFPPNPYRRLDNSQPTNLPLPGHHSSGRFSPVGTPLPNGNAERGKALFFPPNMLDGAACVSCHTLPTGSSTPYTFVNGVFVPFPDGPHGEKHQALIGIAASTNEVLKAPQMRSIYERTGFDNTQLESTAGFGFMHDGNVDSIARFVLEPATRIFNDQEASDILAFLLSVSGDSEADGGLTTQLRPIGSPALGTHAAVGRQLTFDDASNPPPGSLTTLATLISEANKGKIGLVARGRVGGIERGAYYIGNNLFQTDRMAERVTRELLLSTAGTGSVLTFMAVPEVSERRIGVDRDSDGIYDRDELDAGGDPGDPAKPRVGSAKPH